MRLKEVYGKVKLLALMFFCVGYETCEFLKLEESIRSLEDEVDIGAMVASLIVSVQHFVYLCSRKNNNFQIFFMIVSNNHGQEFSASLIGLACEVSAQKNSQSKKLMFESTRSL